MHRRILEGAVLVLLGCISLGTPCHAPGVRLIRISLITISLQADP